MIRIGTPDGVLTPSQAGVVTGVADEYTRDPTGNSIFGNGHID